MITLKPFQEEAVSRLKNEFFSLWQTEGTNLPLVFKSPTGSGKTIMLAQFLRDTVSDPRFVSADIAFLWFSFSEDSYNQSKKKLFDYYGGASELDLLDLNDLTRGKLHKNNVFFINWQKIKGKSKDSRKLRRKNEWGLTFDNFIDKTHDEGRKLVVIIDEEHIGADTVLALDLINNLVKPRIILRVSATPKEIPSIEEINDKRAGFVQSKRDEVIEAGLIKEKIIFQTEEDFARKGVKGKEQDEMFLELAYQKRLELLDDYKKLGVDVNPLVLIQLPNDDQATRETGGVNIQAIVIDYLKSKGVKDTEIAVWLSKEKENLEDVENASSPVSFLLFKQAAATGWDCPRASVLVMFREIKNPTFAIQTVGRILRMPFGIHFAKPELNMGYLYTNYKRSEILDEYRKDKTENRPAIYQSIRREDIKPIKLESVFMSRTDYNDLGDSFQETFAKIANEHFGVNKKESKISTIKKLKAKELEVKDSKVTTGLIVGVEIDDYDNFIKELTTEGGSLDQEISSHDIERLYNLLCFNRIAKQTDENKKFAPERSWGKLKTALNVWLMNLLEEERKNVYKIIVHDLLKADGGALGPVIGDALASYRPIREKEVRKKSERAQRVETIEVPREYLFFTDQYEEIKGLKKSAMEPFYAQKDYIGKDNEKAFISTLEESKPVIWWLKNGDSGSEFFSIPYHNPIKNKESLFYPDWIVKTNKGLYFLDTKKEATAEQSDTKYKSEALQGWLRGKNGFLGGIVAPDGINGWKVNPNPIYEYSPSFEGWQNLTDFLK